MVTHNPNDPNNPRRRERDPDGYFPDEKARKAATLATILAAIAGLIAIVALIIALSHDHEDKAPQNCDPNTDYVCEPEVVEETTTTNVPSTSMSPTEVPVPTVSPSETVTTTVRP